VEKKLEKEGREQERSNKREGEGTRWGKHRVTESKCICRILPHMAHACVRLDWARGGEARSGETPTLARAAAVRLAAACPTLVSSSRVATNQQASAIAVSIYSNSHTKRRLFWKRDSAI